MDSKFQRKPVLENSPASVQPLRLEQVSLLFAFSLYLLWQINAILHHGSWGQDFGAHVTWINMAKTDPVTWFTTYGPDRTNPPLYHFLASLVFRVATKRPLEAVAFLSLLINMGALYLLYRVIQRLIINPVIRIACMIFLLFLPFAMIHAVVLAADGLATPLFLVLLYLFSLLTTENTFRAFLAIIAAIALTLTFALAIKFTFISIVPAALISFAILYRSGHLSKKHALIGVLAIFLLPAPFGYFELHQYRSQSAYSLGIAREWSNPIYSPYMNVRSLLMVKSVDKMLLLAPPYNFSVDGSSFELLQINHHSYPALLHLAMFTDILNIYQYDPDDSYFGKRTPYAQARMRKAVQLGLIFSIATACTAPLMIFWCMLQVWRKKGGPWACGAIIGILSSAFYLNIVCFLPFVGAYGGGYWLPRLVVPALFCFFILAFSFGDRLFSSRFRIAGWAFLLLVLLQSSLNLSFLWPWDTGEAKSQTKTPLQVSTASLI